MSLLSSKITQEVPNLHILFRSMFPRIVAIMCFAPANIYKPDKLVLATEIQEDKSTNHEGSAVYEFFRSRQVRVSGMKSIILYRGRAWVCGNALAGMTTTVPYSEDGKMLANRLRSVVQELERVADLLNGKGSDAIGFFNEENGKHGARYLGDN